MTASSASAPPVPRPAERQSRAVPAASTIVVASTASTAQARKTAMNSALAAPTPASRIRSLLRLRPEYYNGCDWELVTAVTVQQRRARRLKPLQGRH